MDKISKQTDVLLTNGWDRIAYNILRALSKENLRVAFGSDNYLGMGYYSKYASEKFIHHNYKRSEEKFINDILNAIEVYKPTVFIPTGEEIFAVSRNYDLLSKTGIKIPVSDIRTLESLNNKIFSFKIAESAGIPVPHTIIPSDITDIENFIKTNGLPVIIKRGWSRASQGVFKVDKMNIANINKIIQRENLEYGKFIVQKFVEGSTYGVSLLMNNGNLRAFFTHKRLREKSVKGGPSTLRVGIRNELLENYALKLLKSINFHGVAMVEFKYNENTGDAWFIECNPRFWGSVGLAINSGVNFPYLLYRMAVEGDVEPVLSYKAGVSAKWLLGDIVVKTKSIFSPNSLKHKKMVSKKADYLDDFYKDDPLPFFAWIYLLVRRKIVKLR